MAMMNCAACGRGARKTKIALIPSHGGGTGRARVCLDCFSRAVIIVPVVGTRCACGAPALACVACVRKHETRDAAAVVKAAAFRIRQTAKAYEGSPDESEQEHRDGRVAGLNQAADLLDAGNF